MPIGPKELTIEYMYNREIEKLAEHYGEVIDKHLLSGKRGLYSWHDYICNYEMPIELRDKLAKMYIEAGWSVVVHQVSSENEEMNGNVTYFAFLEADEIPKFFETMTNIESYHIFGSEYFRYSTPCFFVNSKFDYKKLRQCY